MKRKFNNKEEQKFITLYNKGLSTYDIAIKFNTCNTLIGRILKRNNIKRRLKWCNSRKYQLNEQIFNKIDTKQKAYWLGFIMGDGSIWIRSLCIEIHKRDIEHLKKFQIFMQTDTPIRMEKKDMVRIIVNSDYLVKSLNKYGIIQNKSSTKIKTPNIPKKYLKDFYRGFLDADGSIYVNKSKYPQAAIAFTSNYIDILKEIQIWICSSINRKQGHLEEKTKMHKISVSRLTFSGNILFKQIFILLYNNSKIYLDRKYKLGYSIIS